MAYGRINTIVPAYEDAIRMGRPLHMADDFSRRHPRMSIAKRAKIFMPFDALTGFGEQIEERAERTVDFGTC